MFLVARQYSMLADGVFQRHRTVLVADTQVPGYSLNKAWPSGQPPGASLFPLRLAEGVRPPCRTVLETCKQLQGCSLTRECPGNRSRGASPFALMLPYGALPCARLPQNAFPWMNNLGHVLFTTRTGPPGYPLVNGPPWSCLLASSTVR